MGSAENLPVNKYSEGSAKSYSSQIKQTASDCLALKFSWNESEARESGNNSSMALNLPFQSQFTQGIFLDTYDQDINMCPSAHIEATLAHHDIPNTNLQNSANPSVNLHGF